MPHHAGQILLWFKMWNDQSGQDPVNELNLVHASSSAMINGRLQWAKHTLMSIQPRIEERKTSGER